MYTRNEKIITRYIEEEMKDSYINYAMSVIVGRALPDVRDGLAMAISYCFIEKHSNIEELVKKNKSKG